MQIKNQHTSNFLKQSKPILFLLLITLLGGCDACNNSKKGETLSFRIIRTNPTANKIDVSLDHSIAIVFSQELDSNTVTDENIQISNDTRQLQAQISYQNKTIIMTSLGLYPNTRHTVLIKQAVTNIDGTPLNADYEFSFTTGETNADGTKPLPADFRPLGKNGRFYAFNRIVEYMIIGGQYNSSANNLTYIDPLEFNPVVEDTEPATEEILHESTETDFGSDYRKIAVAGNLDDDPQEEVVIINWPIAGGPGTLSIADTGDAFVTEKSNFDLSLDGADGLAIYHYDVAVADIDADGYDEILVTGGREDEFELGWNNPSYSPPGKLWIIEDKSNGLGLIQSIDILGLPSNYHHPPNYGLNKIHVAAENLDHDPDLEIALLYNRTPILGDFDPNEYAFLPGVITFDDFSTDFSMISEESIFYNFNQTCYSELNDLMVTYETEIELILKNMDGDENNIAEIVVGQMEYCTFDEDTGVFPAVEAHSESRYNLQIFKLIGDPVCLSYKFDTEFDLFAYPPEEEPDGLRPKPAFVLNTLDVDGDKEFEILMQNRLLRCQSGHNCGYSALLIDRGLLLPPYDTSKVSHLFSTASNVTAGDVDGDLKDEIIVFGDDGFGNNTIRAFDAENNLEEIDLRYSAGGVALENQILVPANVDTDSTLVEFAADYSSSTGVSNSREIFWGDNMILAVLAAPPCEDNIGQNTDACTTGLATSTGSAHTAGASLSVRVGGLIGFELEVQGAFIAGVTLAKIEGEVTAQIEATGSYSLTNSIEKSITDYAGHKEDLVIFSVTPYDRFIYKIASHPSASVLGKHMVVDLPGTPKILAASREYYNAHNSDQVDIDDTIFTHIPGDISTYPNLTGKTEILNQSSTSDWGSIGPEIVNQGNGAHEIELSTSTSHTFGVETSLSVDKAGKVCTVAVCLGYMEGFTAAVMYEFEISNGIAFISSVGAIDADNYAANQYQYGMFAYRQTLADQNNDVTQNFFVVNYWVE